MGHLAKKEIREAVAKGAVRHGNLPIFMERFVNSSRLFESLGYLDVFLNNNPKRWGAIFCQIGIQSPFLLGPTKWPLFSFSPGLK